MPVVVIRDADRLVLIDGYLRIEALRRLHRDTALATAWPVSEIEALVHHRHLAGARRLALEDAWLLGRLREHSLTMEQMARQLCRSTSWVSRRLGLLEALDDMAHDRVRAGMVPAHAAMKYLVPLVRANKVQCAQLVARLGETRVSDRELGALYVAWKRADRAGKQRIVAEPLLVIRALELDQEHDAGGDRAEREVLGLVDGRRARPCGAGRRARVAERVTRPGLVFGPPFFLCGERGLLEQCANILKPLASVCR